MKSSKCHPCKRRSSQEVTLGEEDLAVEEAGDTLVVAVEAASVVVAEAEVVVAEGFLGGEVVAIDLTGGIRSCCNLNGHFRELCCV
jgi:hypothetical protein